MIQPKLSMPGVGRHPCCTAGSEALNVELFAAMDLQVSR